MDDFVPRQSFPRAEVEFAPALIEHDGNAFADDGACGVARAL